MIVWHVAVEQHDKIVIFYIFIIRMITIPTERPPLVGKVADRGVPHGQCGGSPTAVISVF
jgi:hypothetical protein